MIGRPQFMLRKFIHHRLLGWCALEWSFGPCHGITGKRVRYVLWKGGAAVYLWLEHAPPRSPKVQAAPSSAIYQPPMYCGCLCYAVNKSHDYGEEISVTWAPESHHQVGYTPFRVRKGVSFLVAQVCGWLLGYVIIPPEHQPVRRTLNRNYRTDSDSVCWETLWRTVLVGGCRKSIWRVRNNLWKVEDDVIL